MTIICHSRKFIFLKSRKTAGSSLELWLAPHLDPKTDFFAPVPELKRGSELRRKFRSPSARLRLTAMRVVALKPVFRQHMPAIEVRRFVGERTWKEYRKITIVRDPWDRTISYWRWSQRENQQPISLGDFVAALEKQVRLANTTRSAAKRHRLTAKCTNWPFCAIGKEVVADDIIRYESLESDTRSIFASLGICGGDLPRAKSGIRKPTDGLQLLTPDLIERIAVLHRPEIEAFGYRPPVLARSEALPSESR